MDFGFPASVLTSIEVNDSCYYVAGIIGDSIWPYRTGSIFSKLDLNGDILYTKKLTDSLETFETWMPYLQPGIEDDFINGGFQIGENIFIAGYNTAGDTTWFTSFTNPHNESLQILFYGVQQMPDSNFIVLASVRHLSNNFEAYLFKTTREGEIIWENFYSVDNLRSIPRKLIKSSDGNMVYLVGGVNNTSTENNGFTYQNWIIKVNSDGETQWQYLSPIDETIRTVEDIILTEDGGMVVATEKGIEQASSPTNGYMSWSHHVYKLDANRELEWELDVHDSLPRGYNVFNKLMKLNDDSGYIGVGQIELPQAVEPGFDSFGFISKVSPEGDSVWTRLYQFIESPAEFQTFYDVAETPDGGIIMVGQSTDYHISGDPPIQQGWILKVDQNGCLVPDCDLVMSVDAPDTEISIILFPNPTSDYLNIHYNSLSGEQVEFNVIDLQGRIHKSFRSELNDITYVLPVYDLPAGQYYLIGKNRQKGVISNQGFSVIH